MAYLANFVVGTCLSIAKDIPARPFGLGTGWGVRRDVALGFGCGLAAPWPMIVLLAGSGRSREHALGLLFLGGALSEPVTYRAAAGRTSRPEAVVVALNVAIPLTMILDRRVGRSGNTP